jgi:outer membrane protein assembly factor BamB
MPGPTATASKFAGCWLVISGVVAPSAAVAAEAQSFSFELLWSTQIAAPPPEPVGRVFIPEYGTGLVLTAQAIFPDGRVAFLGRQLAPKAMSPVLLTDAERDGAESGVTLKLRGGVSTLAIGAGGEIWVGGASNMYVDWTAYRHSDAYLARLDATGRPLWEKSYGNGGRRSIKSITRMSSGDLAVAGSDEWDGWLARITADGRPLWERHIGNDLGNAVASLPDNRLIVVGFESTGSGSTKDYQVHVIAWIIVSSGNIVAQTRVRNSISRVERSYFGKISVAVTADAVYVASNWQGLFDARAVEVAKLRLDGTLLWSTLLPDTIKAVDTAARATWRICSPTLAITPRGDAVVACSLESQIHVYQLDGSSGSYRDSYLALPECHSGRPATVFLAIRDNRTMILSGSRPDSNVASCTWVARLTAVP